MLTLDHLTIVAPTLAEGADHARACLNLDIPFGQRHAYMGTHNHLLQLGGRTYLEIVALDPAGSSPDHPRWFGLDDQKAVRADWEKGRRLRGWVARADGLDRILRARPDIFGRKLSLAPESPTFDFAFPEDGSFPLDGAAPCLIDRRGKPRDMTNMPELGARLLSLTLECPDPDAITALLGELKPDWPIRVTPGAQARYRAAIQTPTGARTLW